MPAGFRGLRRIQIGTESVKGTAVAASAFWVGKLGMMLNQELYMPDDLETGIQSSYERSQVIARETSMPFESDATYEQLMYPLEMGVGSGAITDAMGTDPTIWTYAPSYIASANPRSFTLEYGDDVQAYASSYVGCRQLEMSGQVGDVVRVNADLFGRDMGQNAFSTDSSGDAIVPPSRETVKMAHCKVYAADDWADLLTSPTASLVPGTLVDFNWRYMNGFSPVKFADGRLDFSEIAEAKRHVELDMTIAFNATTAGWWRTLYRQQNAYGFQLKFDGSGTGTALEKSLDLNTFGKMTEFGTLAEREGQNIVKVKIMSEYDGTVDVRESSVVLRNTVASIP